MGLFGLSPDLRRALRAAALLVVVPGAPAWAGDPPTRPSLDDLLNQKVSAAAKYEQTVREAAASVTIVTSQDIEDFGFETVAELLSSVRGFYLSYDRNYEYVGVRGFSRPTDYNDRILLLVDGHTVNENTYGGAQIGTDLLIPLDAVERVEIVRGPGSALYGTYAMLAVINVITRSGAAIDGLRASAELGSFRRKGGALTWGKTYGDGLDLLVSVNALDVPGRDHFYSEYADEGDGVARGLDGDRAVGMLLSARLEGTALHAGATSRTKEIPTGAYGVTFGDPRAETVDRHQWVDASRDFPLAFDKALSVRVFADRYFYEGSYPYDVPYRDRTTGVWAGAETRLTWDLRSDHRLTFGAEYRYNFRSTYEESESGSPFTGADVSSSAVAFYVQDEVRLHRQLSLTAGLRYDRFSTTGSGLTPRAGLVYDLGRRGAVKLLYGEAFRSPSTYEVLYAAVPEGGVGDTTLQSERIRTLELTVEDKPLPWLVATLSGHRYQMRDLIDPAGYSDGSITYGNKGRVTATGLEAQLDTRLPGGLRLGVSYGLESARDQDDVTLTNSPRHIFKASLAGGLLGGAVHAGLRLRCESGRGTVYGTETASWCVTDLSLRSRPVAGLSLSLTLRNALDRDYATPGGLEHRQPAIQQDGRSLVGRLTWSY